MAALAHEVLATEYPIPREEIEAILVRDGSWLVTSCSGGAMGIC